MHRWKKLGVVLLGYAIAIAASASAVALHERGFTPADNLAMGGRIAGGSAMLGAAVFMVVALVPTAMAFLFLRESRAFWSALSIACLAFAAVGLVVVLVTLATGQMATRSVVIQFVDLLGIVQMLGSPLWIAAFVLFGFLAPAKDLRGRIWIAASIELIVAAIGVLHFLVPLARR